MNRQTIIIVVTVVALVHLAFFYAATHMKPRIEARVIPRPSFGVKEESYRDAETGEKLTYREIRVSTRIIEPAEMKRLEALRDARLKATPTP